jgi:hypothetical protein
MWSPMHWRSCESLSGNRTPHESSLTTRQRYAEVLSNARDYAQAIQMDDEALRILRERLGPRHF